LFWGGFDNDGLNGADGNLLAADDGDGNIVGNVLTGGTVLYDVGRVTFEWNTDAPPSPAVASYPIVFGTPPDGSLKTFSFTTGINFITAQGVGRLKFKFSGMSTSGISFQDAYDNWQGSIHGPSLDEEQENHIDYATGTGTLTLKVAPLTGTTFTIEVTNTAILLYAGWSYTVKSPSMPGLDKGLFADNNGRLWGLPGIGTVNMYPTDRLDHRRGRYLSMLDGALIAAGRRQILSYDALTGVPPALDIPLAGNEVASLGKVSLTEQSPEQAAII
jgi:hypothetical protein